MPFATREKKLDSLGNNSSAGPNQIVLDWVGGVEPVRIMKIADLFFLYITLKHADNKIIEALCGPTPCPPIGD